MSMVLLGLRSRLSDRGTELALVFFVSALGFLFYLGIFLRSPLITGVDGPYYLVQVRSILATGALAYGDPPLTFYLLSLFSLLLGDISLGVKVGVSFLCALSAVPAFFLMKRVGRGALSGLVAMLLTIFSAPYVRMMTDFMKNAVGICWLLAFVYYLHDLASSGFKKSSLILATFFLVLAGLTHVLVLGVCLLFLAFYTVAVLLSSANRRSFIKAASVIASAACIFVLVASMFFAPLFADFGKVSAFLGDLAGLQSAHADMSIAPRPRSEPSDSTPDLFHGSLSIIGGWGVVLLILSSGVVLSFFAWKGREREALWLVSSTTAVGFMISFPLIPDDWLGRFLLMMVVPTAIILGYAVSRMLSLGSGSSRSIYLIPAVVFLLFFGVQSVSFAGRIHPTITNEGYNDLVEMRSDIPPDSIIVVPGQHGIGYWVEYVGDAEILGMGEELSPGLWRSHSHVLGLFFKGQVPRISRMRLKEIFVGDVFVLVELPADALGADLRQGPIKVAQMVYA